jgi:hypothetical protein
MVPALQTAFGRRRLQIVGTRKPSFLFYRRNFLLWPGFNPLTKGAVARQFYPYTIPATQPPIRPLYQS